MPNSKVMTVAAILKSQLVKVATKRKHLCNRVEVASKIDELAVTRYTGMYTLLMV